MNNNYFKEYELIYKAYIVLPATTSITFKTHDNLSQLITKEIERVEKCILAPVGTQLTETGI